jgi:hypothetical protein
MSSTLDPIPNSSGVSYVLSTLFSFCYTYLKDARPLSGTSHEVTSLMKPQEGASLLSRIPAPLLAFGVIATLGTVYWIASKIFRTPPSQNSTKDLKERTEDLTPKTIVGSSDQTNGTGTGSLPSTTVPVIQGNQDGSPTSTIVNQPNAGFQPPLDIPVIQDNQNGSPTSTVPTQSDAGLQSLLDASVVRANNDELPTSTVETQSNAKLQCPLDLTLTTITLPTLDIPFLNSSSSEQKEPISSGRNSPPSSYTNDTDSSSNTNSPPVTRTPSPTKDKEQLSTVQKLVGVVTYFISTGRHFTKWTKYRLIQEQLEVFSRSKKIAFLRREIGASGIELEITNAWNDLIEALLEPTRFPTPDDQYRKTVECLRHTRQLLISSEPTTQQRFAIQLQFVRELSFVRFADIEIFPYCRELIEYASGEPLPLNLTLDTFQAELKHRTNVLKSPTESTTMNPISCQVNKFKGTGNVYFDPLLNSNIPYRDGVITVNDWSTTILWHGTPVQQHDPYGLMFDLATGFLSYIPYVNNWLPQENPVSSPPVINADYVAFIEEAALQGQNILHIILENGTKKNIGDESRRVKARLRLAVKHDNFFALALRLDGDFFERHDEFKDQVEAIDHLKGRLKKQLLMPLRSFEEEDLTVSILDRKQMEDQLATNGFGVPQKLREACELDKHIDSLLDEVEQIYFSGKEHIKTQEEHQAFLILSYVHIILFACKKMKISILEALCKDDKDRGNVIKTILKLHCLYITGQVNHETLTYVLVHVLARPFILQKAPIIKSRLVLLERVIPFIKDAHDRVPVLKKLIFGESIENASYIVAKPLGQTIYPNNATSRTIEEYQAFLGNHQPIVTSSSALKLMVQLVLGFHPKGKRQDQAIQLTTSSAAKIMNIWVGEKSEAEQENAHATIISFLRNRCSLPEEQAWRMSCYFNEGLGKMLLDHLNEIFANRSLGISVKLETGLILPSIRLTEDNKTARLRFDALFSISNGTTSYGQINASMTIKDLNEGQSQFEYSLSALST